MGHLLGIFLGEQPFTPHIQDGRHTFLDPLVSIVATGDVQLECQRIKGGFGQITISILAETMAKSVAW